MFPTHIDIYLNWLLYAIYGHLAEADLLMRGYGDSIRRVADALRAKYPIEERTLYRGVLLDPEQPFGPDPQYMSVSWSEDVEVARWFALRDSFMSRPLVEQRPQVRGYILAGRPAARVLFHYSWRRAFAIPPERLALLSLGREASRQIAWSLRTQCEVITEQPAELPIPQPVELVPGAPIAELDRQYTPSWMPLTPCTA